MKRDLKTDVLAASLATLATVFSGCAASEEGDEPINDGDPGAESEIRQGASCSRGFVCLPLDDVDGDKKKEQLIAETSKCGTGGCTFKVKLSRAGDAGEIFAKEVSIIPGEVYPSGGVLPIMAVSTGGPCSFYFDYYEYKPATKKFARLEDRTDCTEVFASQQAPNGSGGLERYVCEEYVPKQCPRGPTRR